MKATGEDYEAVLIAINPTTGVERVWYIDYELDLNVFNIDEIKGNNIFETYYSPSDMRYGIEVVGYGEEMTSDYTVSFLNRDTKLVDKSTTSIVAEHDGVKFTYHLNYIQMNPIALEVGNPVKTSEDERNYLKFTPSETGMYTLESTNGCLLCEGSNQLRHSDFNEETGRYVLTWDLRAGKDYYFCASNDCEAVLKKEPLKDLEYNKEITLTEDGYYFTAPTTGRYIVYLSNYISFDLTPINGSDSLKKEPVPYHEFSEWYYDLEEGQTYLFVSCRPYETKFKISLVE
ncbi:hypothetical protein P261_00930 [Lachnospiraceae bacterium TWA4]|nr:hypothetical protein P261_00930 [Lachnospiraceae bacterium TWA4]